MRITIRKIIILVLAAGAIAAIFFLSDNIFETNNEGFYQVKQAAFTGKMSVRNVPGTYLQLFGRITPYSKVDVYHFSQSTLEGGGGEESEAVEVRFYDGGLAKISGTVTFQLPVSETNQLKLHEAYTTYDNMKMNLIRQSLIEAIKHTANLMKTDDLYTGRLSEFASLVQKQLEEGLYETETEEIALAGGDTTRIVNIKYGPDGNPLVNKPSSLKKYNITIVQVNIKDVDFDDTIDTLIAQKQKAEQEKAVARSLAEKARQETITAQEEGKALVAKAQYEKEVEKIKAVTQAQQEKEVAELKAEQELKVAELNLQAAEMDANAQLTLKKAEAEANTLLVKAGLTPRDRAEIDKETAIGVAAEISKLKLPQIMSFGTGTSGTSPIEAIGINQMLDVIDKMSKNSLESSEGQ